MSTVPMAIDDDTAASARADDQRMLRDAVAAFAARDTSLARARELRATHPGFDRAMLAKMAGLGWLGILVPEQYGGQGLGLSEMRIVACELAKALVPEPLNACAVLARGALQYGDNEALKRSLLPKLASGEIVLALAWQESNGDFDAEKITTRATRAGGGQVLNGTKRFVAPAAGADGFIISARDQDAVSLFYVPAGASGLECDLEPRTDGSFCGRLRLQDVPVEAAHVVASSAAASLALRRALDEATVIAGAELHGIMTRALEITLDYMRTRVQFGKPIGSFQALQHRAVDLYIQRELALGAIDDAVRIFDGTAGARERAAAASRVKSRCSDAALSITREAIKLHGAIGFTDECDIGLYLQRTLVLCASLGNAAEHRRRYAQVAAPEPDPVPSKAACAAVARGPRLRESPPDTDWNAMSDAAFRTEVRQYFEQNYPPQLRYLMRRARWSETRDWALDMSRKGWIAPAWPRQYGGMGLAPGKLLIFIEEQERWGVARAPDQGILMLGPLLMKFGSEEQKREYLPKIISCEHVWCQGYSEPNAGSDLASLATSAELDGDHFVINGQKIWSSLAQDGTHMFMLARTDKSAKRQEGISFFVLDLKTPGVTVRPIRNIEGHEEFCQEFFDDVRIPRRNLVGELNQGWTVAKALLGFERLNNGSPRRVQYPLRKLEIVARQRGLWDDAAFHAKYTALRLDVADLASAYTRYSDIVRQGKVPGPDISLLKVWAGETLQRLAELLLESAGAAGCVRGELEFGADLVDLLGPFYMLFGATIAAGTNDIQRNILAKRVLNLP